MLRGGAPLANVRLSIVFVALLRAIGELVLVSLGVSGGEWRGRELERMRDTALPAGLRVDC